MGDDDKDELRRLKGQRSALMYFGCPVALKDPKRREVIGEAIRRTQARINAIEGPGNPQQASASEE